MQFTRGGNSVLYFGLFSYETIKSCMSIKEKTLISKTKVIECVNMMVSESVYAAYLGKSMVLSAIWD